MEHRVENGFGGTLPSGTYESVQSFDNLLGCPLNGTWTVEVCDMFAIDNGFILAVIIHSHPSYIPELLSFTPSIGMDCDSSFWTGNFITDIDQGCNKNVAFVLQRKVHSHTFILLKMISDVFIRTKLLLKVTLALLL